jgi:membrane-bound ClpP family serine protease
VGVVRIDGSRYDALAESGVIETGTAIIVTEAYDNQLKVRTTHDAPPTG